MASKWAFIRGKYPKLEPESDYAAKVDAVVYSVVCDDEHCQENGETLLDLDDRRLKDYVVRKKREKAEAEAVVKRAELELAAATKVFVERFDEGDITKMQFDDGVTISVNPEPYPLQADRDAFLAWVRETGQEQLLTVNYQTLASLVKDCIMNGKTLPPGIDVFVKDKLSKRGKGETNDATNAVAD